MRPTKRTFDLTCSSLGLVILSPVLAAIALLIKREDGGPVFYRPTRIGRAGQPFRLWKFRTMVTNAEEVGGPLTVGADPRITRVGSKLRRWKLDELPQLLNVIAGEMSLVGPRPEAPELVARYSLDQRAVLRLTPGITDPASIQYADESTLLATSDAPEEFYVEYVMPEKIRMNEEYAARATLLNDIRVVGRTLFGLIDNR